MFDDLKLLQTYSAMAQHAAQRHQVLATNIANADTPGYKTKDIAAFAEVFQQAQNAGVSVDQVTARTFESPSMGVESPNGNNVSLEDQMLKTAENKGDHDMALAVYRKTLDLLRLSMGRNN